MEQLTLTIRADPHTLERIKRLLGLIEACAKWGHTAHVGTWIDGDGPDRVDIVVEGEAPLFEQYGSAISEMESGKGKRREFVGRIEMAQEGGYALTRYIDTRVGQEER